MVRVGNSYSDRIQVNEATAQGSVLGPLHYLAYVNDLNNLIKKCSIYQFADDTCLIAADRDINVAQSMLQNDLTLLNKWSHDVGLVLNAQKTKMMHVHSSHNVSTQTAIVVAHGHSCMHDNFINCKCEPVEQVRKHTYLGLVIDDRFNWGPHVDIVCDRLRAVLAKFYLTRYKIPYSIMLSMYHALAESIVSYGLTSYGRTYKSYLAKINNLQTRLLKIIVPKNIKDMYHENYAQLYKYCKVIPIQEKIKYALIIERYQESLSMPYVTHKILTRQVSNRHLTVRMTKNTW